MAQGCIPTTPVGGTPTPNPNSHITYKQFNQSLEDTIPSSENIDIEFDDILPMSLEKFRTGLFMMTDVYYNVVHDTTTELLVKRSTYNVLGMIHYTTNYALALNTKVNAASTEWNNGLIHNLATTLVESGITSSTLPGAFAGGKNDLYSRFVYDAAYWSIAQQTQNFYVAFRSPLISDPSKYAYGWLQLRSVVDSRGSINYLKSLQLIDGAIETNVGEIYVGNH